jgi:hypothetical protein
MTRIKEMTESKKPDYDNADYGYVNVSKYFKFIITPHDTKFKSFIK